MKIEFPEIIEFKKEITKLFVSQNVEWKHPNLWLQVTIHSSSSIKNSSKLAVTTDFIYDVPTIFNKKSRSPKNYRAPPTQNMLNVPQSLQISTAVILCIIIRPLD